MTEPDASELLQQASAGDAGALQSLLERNLPRLRAFVRLQVGAELRAREGESDIVQSICRQVLQDADAFEFRGEASFRAWLFQATLSKVRDKVKFHRREKRDVRRELDVEDDKVLACYLSVSSPSQGVMRQEQKQIFERVFEQLQPAQQQVVTLAKIVGLSTSEIAVEIGRTEAATRVFLHRSLARLGVLLDQAQQA